MVCAYDHFSNREVQHVNKSPGFTLVVHLEVAFLFITKSLTSLLKQPTNMQYTYSCLSPHCLVHKTYGLVLSAKTRGPIS